MKAYLPKIIYNSPTKLPNLEKIILYYIIDKAFKAKDGQSTDLNLELDIKELLEIISNSNLDLIDIKLQTREAVNNLQKITLSLLDNGFHIKVSPIESIYLDANTIYTTLNPIIVEYLEQIFNGNYVVFDLLTNSIIEK